MPETSALASSDAERAERAWLAGDVLGAVEAADRALGAGDDPEGQAAAVAAAAAAADGALSESAARWRALAARLTGPAAVRAGGRAALVAAMTGAVGAADVELAAARAALADPAPRSLVVLLDGVDAVLAAVRGDLDGGAARLTALAAATVPPDPYAVTPWTELAALAGAAADHLPAQPPSPLVAAFLHLRAGRLDAARAALTEAAAHPASRRGAVLAAAVTVGIARRTGSPAQQQAAWQRVAPVVAGAEVELLLLDAWGELAMAAPPRAQAGIDAAVAAAVTRAGEPAWCRRRLAWWRLQRAAAHGSLDEVRAAAGACDGQGVRAEAAAMWVAVLEGRVDAPAVRALAERLVRAGLPEEAAQLCRAAATRAGDPAAARILLGAGRAVGETRSGGPVDDGPTGIDGSVARSLTAREREVGALVLDGLTQRQIGARLFLSPKTVEQHVARLRQKLGAADRAELVAALRPSRQRRTG